MSKEKILEGNKLIADFMEVDFSIPYSWRPEATMQMTKDCLAYERSWDWLMPVICKIEALGYRWEIGMSATLPYHYCKIWSIGKIEGISPLYAIHGAIIEFIKWYNNK